MKIVSLLLVIAMLLSFAACNTAPVDPVESGDATDSTTPEETTTADTMDIQTGAQSYNAADYLPAETFDGEEIHIWVDGHDAFYNIPEERIIEGDIVHTAVLERNALIEDTYDIVFNWDRDYTVGWRNQADLRQSILAGDEYDILEGPALYLNPQLVYGCYIDLANNEYIDFNQPWWIEEATANQRVYDRQFTAVGYFDFTTITRIGTFFFNDTMVIDYRLGNLYDLVESGEWTWDKMVEMCEIVAEDVNQDGVMDGADKYGFSSRWDFIGGLTLTAGYQYVTRDAEGEYVITGVTDTLLEIADKVYPVINGTDLYFSRYTYGVHPSYPAALDTEGKTMFTNNQILFMLEHLAWTSSSLLRDFGAYGILPAPKLLEGQEDYSTGSSSFVCAICSTSGDTRISSIILEALQIESYNTLRPAYTVDALSYKYLSDPQAVEMLNLIFREVSTEWAYNFSQAGLGSTLTLAFPTQTYLAPYFQKNAAAIEQKMEDFLQSVDALP